MADSLLSRQLLGVTTMTLLSYGGEYMAFTAILAWLYNLLIKAGVDPLEAYGFGFLVSAAFLLVSGVLAVPFGSLSDRFGRRRLAILGCVAAGVSILALPLTGSFTNSNLIVGVISILLLVVGIGHGTYTASALAYAGDVSSERDVGQAYGLVETAEYAMFMFGTPLGFIVAALYGIIPTFIITGGILLVAGLTAAFGMPERRTYRLVSAASGLDHASTPDVTVHETQARLLYNAIRDGGVLVALLAVFFVSIGFTAFRIYMTQYGTSGQVVPLVGPYLVSIMAAASVLAGVPIGRLVDTSRKRVPILVLGLIIESIALAAILVRPNAISLVLWSVVFGVAIMLVRVPQAVIVAERTTIDNRAGAMGANHAVEHVGYGVGAFLGGLLIVFFSLNLFSSFVVFAVVTLVAALVLISLKDKAKLI